MRIPVYEPCLDEAETENVLKCLREGWISSKGEFIDRFEADFANYVGSSQAISVSNGTVALHLALLALGLGPGDEVIIPGLTYVATANSVAYVGATPVLSDINPDDWNIDVDRLESLITSKTKAIIPVHLYGMPCHMEQIVDIASRHNLFIIEDCAEALGSKINGKHVGTFGDIATFSFYGNKTITTGEGGMVVTNDRMLGMKTRKLKGQGLSDKEYYHDVVGYNYRMTNICAAIGVAQLGKLNSILTRKSEIADRYRCALSLFARFQPDLLGYTNSYWMVSCILPGCNIAAIRNHLSVNGIETRPFFYPINKLPMYKACSEIPTSEKISPMGLNLPSSPNLTDRDVDFISKLLVDFMNNNI
jgi:perosamine synthetase